MACVLIVDDSATVRQQVRIALRSESHDVLEASDGAMGWESLQYHPEVDLVIVDLKMPEHDGFHFLTRVHDHLGQSSPPLLVLTATAEPALMKRAKALGATGWITKPVSAPALVEAVRQLLG